MSDQYDALEQVRQMALLKGFELEHDHQKVRLFIDLPTSHDRLQTVFIEGKGFSSSPDHKNIITIVSRCLELEIENGGIIGHECVPCLDWKELSHLLLDSEKLHFVRFGIRSESGRHYLVASCDHMVDAMHPEELEAQLIYIAEVADECELRMTQKDVF